MSQIYRVLRRLHAQTPFDGEGAYRYGGRWSSPGTRLSYASERQSLAMLEYFVHLDAEDPPTDLVLAIAVIPDEVARRRIENEQLPANWRESPAPPELASYGDEFARRAECVALIVPSAIVPAEENWLLNPQHPDFGRVTVHPVESLDYARLFRRERRKHRSR